MHLHIPAYPCNTKGGFCATTVVLTLGPRMRLCWCASGRLQVVYEPVEVRPQLPRRRQLHVTWHTHPIAQVGCCSHHRAARQGPLPSSGRHLHDRSAGWQPTVVRMMHIHKCKPCGGSSAWKSGSSCTVPNRDVSHATCATVQPRPVCCPAGPANKQYAHIALAPLLVWHAG